MNNIAVVLAGGQGKRMKSDSPKVLCNVLGEPMLEWVISACESAGLEKLCVVKGFCAEKIDEYLAARKSKSEVTAVLQAEQLGTGHAVMMTEEFLKANAGGNVLILNGDAPFIDAETINSALDEHTSTGSAVTVVTAKIDDPKGYGRIIRGANGFEAIVEHKDCTPEQLAVNEVNSGCYWFGTADLLEALGEITTDNAQGEYYLTDCIEILLKKGRTVGAFTSCNPSVVLGANDRRALLELNNIARMEIIGRHLDNGIEFTCTDGVSVGRAVTIGRGTVIHAGTELRGNTVIGENCVIGRNCILENVTVGSGVDLNNVQAFDSVIDDDVKIGPFVQVRPGCHIKRGAKIGDFVEIKNSTIGEYTAVAHLTYVGDSDVGANVNFGCGVVTVNYNGEKKFRTVIGDNAFIGCNTNLVAPVKIGNSAYTAAGSTITKDVPDNALAIERGKQDIKADYAVKKLAHHRQKLEDKKNGKK
ncbi:MAG: bifunctional UDP-N-acetylglucosamine diphosphorylase/glucosamine-1-phosphate N-acetyltransferase GlmU [Ruminococcus sp.]|nr:bifunctional UDP-N-acetylglucosamine diphosphorylase/glucosamine-1-phosphate N-acetyltransferase GlmU [Ruminococcus sp.]